MGRYKRIQICFSQPSLFGQLFSMLFHALRSAFFICFASTDIFTKNSFFVLIILNASNVCCYRGNVKSNASVARTV